MIMKTVMTILTKVSGKYIELLIKDGYDSFFTDFSDPDWTSNQSDSTTETIRLN